MKMNKLLIFFLISLSLFFACNNEKKQPKFITTSASLAMILQELVGSDVEYILPNGASPHTYTPKPSDVLNVAKSEALFFIARNNDGWAEKLDSKRKIEVFRLLPESLIIPKSKFNVEDHHDHAHTEEINDHDFDYEEFDSHFWTDPMTVKALLPMLVQQLSEIDPNNAKKYKRNADKFAQELDKLHIQIIPILQVIKDKPIFLFHPSFLYLINRYGLTYGGSIEWNPGEESTPITFADLITKIKSSGVKAIFSEPQLSDKSAKVLAEQTGTQLSVLDPVGGIEGRKTYREFILYNVNTLKRALE